MRLNHCSQRITANQCPSVLYWVRFTLAALLCSAPVETYPACSPVASEVGGDIPLQLPFQGGPFKVTQGYCCNCSDGDHTGYQVDFGLPVGTPVVAASSGTVIDVND